MSTAEPELDLERAILICLNCETASHQVQSMKSSTEKTVDAIQVFNRSKKPQPKQSPSTELSSNSGHSSHNNQHNNDTKKNKPFKCRRPNTNRAGVQLTRKSVIRAE
ncbi:hypothetical protein CBL_06365 [Carabus blaptoides fortunei]